MKRMLVLTIFCMAATALIAGDAHLDKVISGKHRAENAKRDKYRNPAETLAFFGIKPDMTVVEFLPGGGWYTEILAPYLKDNGKLIAASYDRDAETQKAWMKRVNKTLDDKLANKKVYGAVATPGFKMPGGGEIAPAGSVDMILDFRNAHNWITWDAEGTVKTWHKILKKGGVVGIVDHRMDTDKEPGGGYIHEKQVIELMEKHGFKLAAKSEINANAKDTKDHPNGVWTLPPSNSHKTRDGEELDGAKYAAIGESDRMTLKFVKQ